MPKRKHTTDDNKQRLSIQTPFVDEGQAQYHKIPYGYDTYTQQHTYEGPVTIDGRRDEHHL